MGMRVPCPLHGTSILLRYPECALDCIYPNSAQMVSEEGNEDTGFSLLNTQLASCTVD